MDAAGQPLTGLRWEDITEDDLLAILQADAEPSYAASLIHEPFAFTRHLLNTPDKANPPMHPRQPQHPQRAPSPGFASPTTASLSTTSPFGLSSPSSVDEPGMPSTHEHAFPYPPHGGDHGAQPGAAFFAYPPVPSPASSMSMPPPPQRPGKRARGQEETPGMEPPPAHRKMQHACTHCKKLKMKCTFAPGNDKCDRCIKKGHPECRVEGRKRNPGPNARELLLREMKAKDALIAGLLKHIFDPHMGTPLALAPGRIDPASLVRTMLPPSPPATATSDDDDQRTEQQHARQKAASGSLLSLLTQAGASLRAPTSAWRLEEESDSSDEPSSDDESEDAPRAKPPPAVPVKLHSLPSDFTPHGLIARMSLDDPVPTALEAAIGKLEPGDNPVKLLDEVGALDPAEQGDAKNPPMPKIPPTKVGLENPRYYHPGPGGNLPLREIIIERQMSIEILDYGVVKLDEVNELFDIFFKTVNPALSILDEQLHTPTATRKRCPFLFTVVCAAASRYYTKRPELYGMLMHFAKKQAASSLIDGWKSVELCQAYIILGDYAPSARRWEEDRSYLYKGLAIRIAMDLNLHQPSRQKPQDEMHAREILNSTRTWLICFNIDRSASTQFGKCATLPNEDLVVRASKEWYASSPYNHPYDVHLCAYVQLLRLMTQFHDIVQDRGAMRINKNIDYLAVTRIYDDQLTAFKEEWTERFAQASDPNDPAAVYRVQLMPVIVNYCKLVMYSFGFQHAFEKGLARGDPFFLRCWNAATSVVRGMAEVLGPTGFLKYTAECHFVFGTFASGFLFKLLRPEFAAMVDAQQKDSILTLVTKLADVFERNAIDETHAPRLYARFLYGLVRKHSGAPAEASQSSSSSSTPPAPAQRGAAVRSAAPPRGNASKPSRAARSSVAQLQPQPSASTSSQQAHGGMPPPPPPPQYQPDPNQMNYPSSAWHGQQQTAPDMQLSGSYPYSAAQDYSAVYPQGLAAAQFYGDAFSQQQQWAAGTYYGAGQTMDLDEQLLLPIRAINNPAFHDHMLLPGWNPHDSHSSGSSTGVTTPAQAPQAFPATDMDSSSSSAASFFGAAQSGTNAYGGGGNMW